jgi:hypothetical protein
VLGVEGGDLRVHAWLLRCVPDAVGNASFRAVTDGVLRRPSRLPTRPGAEGRQAKACRTLRAPVQQGTPRRVLLQLLERRFAQSVGTGHELSPLLMRHADCSRATQCLDRVLGERGTSFLAERCTMG